VFGSEYHYTFYTDEETADRSYVETSNKTFDQFLKHSSKNSLVKKTVQIRAALEYIYTQDASLYSLKKYTRKKHVDPQAEYHFFSQLLHRLREKKLDGLLIKPEIIAEPERYFLRSSSQPKHSITYRFEDNKSYIFSLHEHDHNQKILPNCIDTTYLLDLKVNTTRYVLDIIQTSNYYVVGMALFDFPDFPETETIYISRLYIASDHRKFGLGATALECITRFAAIRKANHIELHIQPFGYYKAAGPELLEWYRKAGFKIINSTNLLAKKTIPESIPLDKGHVEILFN
jgi:GNAT superfamily N-acetyltransferase